MLSLYLMSNVGYSHQLAEVLLLHLQHVLARHLHTLSLNSAGHARKDGAVAVLVDEICPHRVHIRDLVSDERARLLPVFFLLQL